jgi:hypothetical protein
MYSVKTNDSHLLVLTGHYANPATTPIDITQGWNYIGYVPSSTMTVKNALAGMNAQIGDQLKGQTGFATYAGSSGWIGNLTYMQAGKGYMYYSNNASAQSFVYPSFTASVRGEDELKMENGKLTMEEEEPRWTVNPALYSNTMTVTAVVINDMVEMRSDMVEIGAFSGTECRGTITLQYVETLDRYVGFLMIYGNGNETITLKVYDHATEMEYEANNGAIGFVADAILGSPEAAYVVSLGMVGIDELTIENGELIIYPNPVQNELSIVNYQLSIDKVEIYDVMGRLIDCFATARNDGSRVIQKEGVLIIDVSGLSTGVYLLKVISNEKTIVKRFVKK